MKYSARRPGCCFLLTIIFALCANAQNQVVPQEVRAFASRYVAAINAKDEAPQRKKLEAHYKALADGIQQPLRGELIVMLRGHKRSSALARYRESSGQDYKTSIFVINDLEEQLDPH